jgi:tetratricopeptide (TPR) repeat protein
MREDQLLQQAILQARAGHELTARDMFLDIVRKQPRNETAWMWLTGLLDDLDECIEACEQVLDINPNNEHARLYLQQLLMKKDKQSAEERNRVEEQARAVREAAKSGEREVSLGLVRELTRQRYVSVDTWRLLAELSTDLHEQTSALEKLLELKPGDEHAKSELKRLKHFQENPFDLAALYEEEGNLEKALNVYRLIAIDPKFRNRWNEIYSKVMKLENLQQEKIAHVAPRVSIVRLTFAPTLLYLVLMLVHVGVNPLAHPDPLLWIGYFIVLLGGYMNALASVRSHDKAWSLLFKTAAANSTPTSRFIMAAGGWILIIIPHVFLFLMAILRMIYPDQS